MKKISLILVLGIILGIIPNAYVQASSDILVSSELLCDENFIINEIPKVKVSYNTDGEDYELRLSVNLYSDFDIIKLYPTNGLEKECVYEFPVSKEGKQNLKVEVLKSGESVWEENYKISYIRTDDDGPGYGNRGFVTHFVFDYYEENDAVLYDALGAEIHRDDFFWATIEKEKGVYDFSGYDEMYKDIMATDVSMMAIVNGRNNLYLNSEGTTYIKDESQFEAYANYALAIAKHYPNITKFELCNEPGFNYTGEEYKKIALAAAKKLKEYNRDIEVYVGCIITDSRALESGTQFMQNLYTEEVYPYIDGVSFHMYANNKYADTKKFYDQANDYRTQIEDGGGWKDVSLTETGWYILPNSGVQEKQQASELVKRAVISDGLGFSQTIFYDFKNDGRDVTNSEHNFGLMSIDHTMRDSFFAMKEYLDNVKKAIYIGKLDMGEGIESHVYAKNDDYFLIAWAPNNDSELNIPQTDNAGASFVFENANVLITDMFGNESGNKNELILDLYPKYVHNLEPEFILDRISRISLDNTKFPEGVIDSVITSFETFLEERSLSALENYLNECYLTGLSLIKDGKFDAESVSEMLWELEKAADKGRRLATCVNECKVFENSEGIALMYNNLDGIIEYFDLEKIIYSSEPYTKGRKLLKKIAMYDEGDKNGVIKGDGFEVSSSGYLTVSGNSNSKLVSVKILKDGEVLYIDTVKSYENKYTFGYELPEFGEYTVEIGDGEKRYIDVIYSEKEYVSVEDKMTYVEYFCADKLFEWTKELTKVYLKEEKNIVLPDNIEKKGNIITVTDEDDSSYIMMAVYEDGRLKGVAEENENSSTVVVDDFKNQVVKLFRWDGLSKLFPLSKALEYK